MPSSPEPWAHLQLGSNAPELGRGGPDGLLHAGGQQAVEHAKVGRQGGPDACHLAMNRHIRAVVCREVGLGRA